jgi:hypothetical protein
MASDRALWPSTAASVTLTMPSRNKLWTFRNKLWTFRNKLWTFRGTQKFTAHLDG